MTTRRTRTGSGAGPQGPVSRGPRKVRSRAVVDDGASRRTALAAAEAALDRKAHHVEIIDVRGKVDYADFLVLATGTSDRHVSAVAEGVDQLLAARGIRCSAVEGRGGGGWVLLDFGDVVVHVFQRETRAVYDLDGLWMDASRLPLPGGSEQPS